MVSEKIQIRKMLENPKVRKYVLKNLGPSLFSIGYSESLVNDLLKSIENLEFENFQKKHKKELEKVRIIDFFQKTVPPYFRKQVIPHIPKSKTILDLGCGTGIMAHLLEKSGKFEEILGIEINEYPEWKNFKSDKVKLKVVKENAFENFLRKTKPDTIVLTWVLHHMTLEEQERYLKKIYSLLDKVTIVALEDSFSTELKPEEDRGVFDSFKNLSLEEKYSIMSILDWLANRIIGLKEDMPIPFAYRTLESWQKLCERIGFRVIEKRYIGFPENRDIDTPQSLIVVKNNYFFFPHQIAPKKIPDKRSHCHAVEFVGVKRIATKDKAEIAPKIPFSTI